MRLRLFSTVLMILLAVPAAAPAAGTGAVDLSTIEAADWSEGVTVPAGTAEAADTTPVALDLASATRPVILSFPRFAEKKFILEAYGPLVRHLERETGRTIVVKIAPNYVEALDRLENDLVDLSHLTPVLYATVFHSDKVELLGLQTVGGRGDCRSVILARADDATIKTLADLAGKKIGFTDPFSVSGYLYPMMFLKANGLAAADGKTAYTPVLLENHDRVLHELRKGTIDAGATYDDFFARDSAGVRLVATYDAKIPQDVFVANRTTLPADLLASFKAAFRTFRGEPGAYLEGFSGDASLYREFETVVKK